MAEVQIRTQIFLHKPSLCPPWHTRENLTQSWWCSDSACPVSPPRENQQEPIWFPGPGPTASQHLPHGGGTWLIQSRNQSICRNTPNTYPRCPWLSCPRSRLPCAWARVYSPHSGLESRVANHPRSGAARESASCSRRLRSQVCICDPMWGSALWQVKCFWEIQSQRAGVPSPTVRMDLENIKARNKKVMYWMIPFIGNVWDRHMQRRQCGVSKHWGGTWWWGMLNEQRLSL